MAQTLKLKRTSVANKVPTTSNIEVAELAFNTNDKALFIRGDNDAIVTLHDEDTLHIDRANNRIGIGTTSPGYSLDVGGSVRFAGTASIVGTLQSYSGAFNVKNIAQDQDLNLQVNDGGTNTTALTVKGTTARVGIGTTSPSQILDVVGDLPSIRVGNDNATYRYAAIELGTAGGNWYISNGASKTTSNSDLYISRATDGTDHRFKFGRDDYALSIYDNADAVKVYLHADGNSYFNGGSLGIGTTSPNSLLHVSHATAPTFRLSRTGTGQVWVQSIDSSGRFQLAEAASEGGTQNIRLQVDDTGEITFNGAYTFPTADGSANQVLQTDGSGNLSFGNAAGGGVTISNNANNRVLTGDGTNANAEANLTFDGSTLDVTGTFVIDTNPAATYGVHEALRIDDTGGTADRGLQFFELCNAGARSHRLAFNTNITTDGSAYTYTQGNYGGSSAIHFGNSGEVVFYVNGQVTSGSTDAITPTERFRVHSDGKVKITGSGTIGGNTPGNGYLQITDGSDTLAFDANEIHTTNNLFINAEDGTIYLRGNDSGAVNLRNGSIQFMDTTRNLLNIGTISSGAITSSGAMTINEGNAFTDLNIKSDRTSGNIGGVNFVDSSNAIKGQVFGTTTGNVHIFTGGQTQALLLDSSQLATFASHVRLNDSKNLQLGNSQDFQLYHNGTNSYVRNYTGNLDIINEQDDGDIGFYADDGSGGLTSYLTLNGGTTEANFHRTTKVDDNFYLGVGAGPDLYLMHDGTDSYIRNNTGNITIQNNQDDGDIIFRSDDGSGGTATYFYVDGGNTNINFDKDLYIKDNVEAQFGSGSDLRVYHDGSDSFLINNTGDLYIRNTADDKDILIQTDNGSGGTATYMNFDGSNERIVISKNVTHSDNVRGRFGGSNDLQIYHDATDSRIENSTGDLYLTNKADDKDVLIQSDNGSGGLDVYFRADGSTGEAKLYNYGDLKLTAKSDGVDITGELQADSLDIDGAGDISGNLVIGGNLTVNGTTVTNSATNTTIEDALIELGSGNTGANSNDLGLILERGTTGDNIFIGWDESSDRVRFATTTATGASTGDLTLTNTNIQAGRLYGNVTGDVTGNADTATTAGTVTTAAQPNITSLGTLTTLTVDDITINGSTISDAGDLTVDVGGDITLDADGGDIRLKDGGTQFGRLSSFLGSLVITSSSTDTAMIIGNTDGSMIMGGHVTLGDNNKSKYGTELEIYTDGTDAFIDEVGSGDLRIRSSFLKIEKYTGETMATFNDDNAVSLYYDNSKKFETTNGGVNITGNLRVSSDVNDALIVGSGNESITFGGWDSGQSDISGLLDGSNFGSLITGGSNGHVVVGLRDNDINDSFSVLSGAGDYMTGTTYDKLAFQVTTEGFTTTGNRLDVKSQANLLQRWYKGSTLIGQANAVSDVQMAIGTGDTGILFNNTTNEVYPWDVAGGAGSNNLLNLGNSTRKWKNLYVGSNIYVDGTVDGRDLQIDGNKLDGIEANATADQTASEILTAIKTVDGSGSGLDADLLDGTDSTSFRRRIFSTNTNATPETRWIAFTKPFISGTGSSEYYHLDLVGYSDIGSTQSTLHYSAYIHVRSNGTSTNTFEVIIEERHKAGSEQFTFGKKQVASTSNIVYFILPEDYSAIEVYNLSDDVGSISTATNSMFSTTDTDPTGITTITPREPLHTDDNISVGTISSGNLTVTGDVAVNSDDLVVSSSNSRVGINVGTPLATLDIDGDVYVRTGHTLFTDILRPYATSTLTIGQGTNDIAKFTGSIKIGNTTIIDSSRNLSNIGTISSGAITTSAALQVQYSGTNNISLSPTSTGGVINARNSSGTSVVVMDGRGTPFIDVTGNLKTGGTTRIDSSGNLSSIGTISCGNITSDTIDVNTAINDNSHGLNITNGSLSGAGNLRIAIPKASGNYSTASQLGGIVIRNETTGGNIVVGAKDHVIIGVGGSDYDERLKATTAGVDITGALTATTKSFDIEHPSKEGMRLRYGSLEGPENGVYVRGKSQEKVILLPDYWPDLIHEDSITVQLTAIGSGQELYVEKIEDNKVYVNGENYFYYIQAERKDVERFEVEYEI